ncbi:MAG: PfkB family carbohydrate kinase [Bacteroidota bacterium]
MPKFDVCALGCVCWDYVGIVDEYPELDEKALLTDLIQMGGGLSATAMSAVAAMGGKAAIFGRMGDDDFGDKIQRVFAAEGVNTDGLEVLPGITSQFAFCVADSATGRRSIFWKPGTYQRMGPGEVDLEALTDCKALLVDHHHLRAATEAAQYARAKGIPVVGDIERVQLGAEEFLAAVEYPVVPRGFVRAFSGEQDLEAGARYVQSLGPRTVIITCGDEGVLAFDGDRRLHQPAYCVQPIVDTTGAGDVFHGAFAYGLALGHDLAQNLRFAGAAAALSCRGLGGRGSWPGFGDVQQLLS